MELEQQIFSGSWSILPIGYQRGINLYDTQICILSPKMIWFGIYPFHGFGNVDLPEPGID